MDDDVQTHMKENEGVVRPGRYGGGRSEGTGGQVGADRESSESR